jgi:hypothetical protein
MPNSMQTPNKSSMPFLQSDLKAIAEQGILFSTQNVLTRFVIYFQRLARKVDLVWSKAVLITFNLETLSAKMRSMSSFLIL